MSVPDAGETCILKVGRLVLRKTEVSGESRLGAGWQKQRTSSFDVKLAARYDLECQPRSGSTRRCRSWNPGGYPEIRQVQAQPLDQSEVLGSALSPPQPRLVKSIVSVWDYQFCRFVTWLWLYHRLSDDGKPQFPPLSNGDHAMKVTAF